MHLMSIRARMARLRRAHTLGLAAVLAAVTLGAGEAATASAASPVTLAPGANTWFPTWQAPYATHICAQNKSGVNGYVTVSPFPYWFHDTLNTHPNSATCDVGYWAGNVVEVTNNGPGSEYVYSW